MTVLFAPPLSDDPAIRFRLDAAAQARLMQVVEGVAAAAPWFTPRMPNSGAPFSVTMTNCGPLGWVSDREGGYRYQPAHPETGQPWPPIPDAVLAIWRRAVDPGTPDPDACLINCYRPGAKMGAHQDRDEADFSIPVVSVSLGQSALFRLGGPRRRDPCRRFELHSGDVMWLAGAERLAFHGIDRLTGEAHPLLPEGGRLNLTMRRARA